MAGLGTVNDGSNTPEKLNLQQLLWNTARIGLLRNTDEKEIIQSLISLIVQNRAKLGISGNLPASLENDLRSMIDTIRHEEGIVRQVVSTQQKAVEVLNPVDEAKLFAWRQKGMQALYGLQYSPSEHAKTRHLHPIYDQLNQSRLRIRVLSEAAALHPHLVLSDSLKQALEDSMGYDINQVMYQLRKPEDLRLLVDLLDFMRDELIMSSFDFANIRPEEDVRQNYGLSSYHLHSKESLWQEYKDALGEFQTLGISNLENIPTVGSRRKNITDHILTPQGVLDGNIANCYLDIAVLNTKTFLKAIQEGLIDISTANRWPVKDQHSLRFYTRSHSLRDDSCYILDSS